MEDRGGRYVNKSENLYFLGLTARHRSIHPERDLGAG